MEQYVPKNITAAHIEQAISEISSSEIPAARKSTVYDLIFNDKKFPPKYVLSIANRYANGEELPSDNFTAHQAITFLQKLNFTIMKGDEKLSFYPELKRFLQQAETEDLKTKDYYKDRFAGLTVKVSFGQGVKAQVPWIAFLNDTDKVSDGIYPVYLYYREFDLLILAFGLSETAEPKRQWSLINPTTISSYFNQNNFGQPIRYGSSYIHKTYKVHELPSPTTIDSDLLEIIQIYEQVSGKSVSSPAAKTEHRPMTQTAFSISNFLAAIKTSGLTLNALLATRFVSSLLTKPFVILTGLSGSGKTKLAQAFVQWICRDNSQYKIVPVAADWTNREPLLGYPNALNAAEYVRPDSGVLDLVLEAARHPDSPYFLILDEMNLSHVERYFADFLSVMESGADIPLHASNGSDIDVPQKLPIPSNLFIIGTVNIDETTNMFSPKVLDRANTIEFRIDENEMSHFLNDIKPLNITVLNAEGAAMAGDFLKMAADKSLNTEDASHINNELVRFFSELKKTGAEFGYRSATEIIRLIYQLNKVDQALSTAQKLDIAIIQKLLPKLHGSRRKLCPVLEVLAGFCISGDISVQKDVFEKEDFDFKSAAVTYPLSLEKITRMYRGAVDNGFASFAEA